jgi:hypothetical protein
MYFILFARGVKILFLRHGVRPSADAIPPARGVYGCWSSSRVLYRIVSPTLVNRSHRKIAKTAAGLFSTQLQRHIVYLRQLLWRSPTVVGLPAL